MAAFPYGHSRSLSLSPGKNIEEGPPPEGYYRSSGQGDIFLFSPSLCSRKSNESTSQSSNSFDTLSYSYSPTDLSAAKFSPPLLPAPGSSRSPQFVEAYLTGAEPKPITRLSPGTPFQELFNSSPAGYWQADSPSISPISRHSSVPAQLQTADVETESEDEEGASGKIESLLSYGKTRSIFDSPAQAQAPVHRPSSPSSLSSLSSVPSSPSALFSTRPAASSQTSHDPTPASSPGHALSTLASPFKLYDKASAMYGPGSPSVRTAARIKGIARTTRRSLAAEIMNQLGQPRGNRDGHVRLSSPSKRSSSPMPALTDSDDENYEPASHTHRKTRKRARPPPADSFLQRKKLRTERSSRATSASATTPPLGSASSAPSAPVPQEQEEVPAASDEDVATYPNRTFPLRVPIHDNFALFYRRFPVSSVIDEELAAVKNVKMPRVADAMPNPPREDFDLYTPRFVKGKGTSKVGLCPICHEPAARGGEGKKVWLSMKFSAFNYHMQYAHGISATTGRPFSPPTAFRTVSRVNPGRHEKARLLEGRCHKCKKWVPVEGVKDVPTKVNEIFWWKHAAACHQGSTIVGECDVFVEDAVYAALAEHEEPGEHEMSAEVEMGVDQEQRQDEADEDQGDGAREGGLAEEVDDLDLDAEGESVHDGDELE
ncbi:hypothetical protein C8Q80DRAFT_1198985 [Daedaleopsis nitida]|nr:hypothetical protein C8Q80DRAFT_1198985 [Daedaleopsis nitida]